MMMPCCRIVISLLLITTTTAFVVVQKHQQQQQQQGAPLTRLFLSEQSDPFDSYVPGRSKELAIKDILIGDGDSAKIGDVLTVAYKGKLMSNGKQFDEGTGFSFKLGEGKVLKGWESGLEGLKVGGKRILRIPPSLAYGSSGAGTVIPPNADLEFECELKGIANGPVAAFIAQLGIGPNRATGFAVLLLISILLPKLGIGDKGFL